MYYIRSCGLFCPSLGDNQTLFVKNTFSKLLLWLLSGHLNWMTVITWCWKRIRRAYAACKAVICCGGGNIEEMDHQDRVHYVDLPARAGEQNPSIQLQTVGPLSQQRRRPDVQPMCMRRFADPEKVAAVFKACKELHVPIGEDRCEDGYDDGSGPTSETRKKTA